MLSSITRKFNTNLFVLNLFLNSQIKVLNINDNNIGGLYVRFKWNDINRTKRISKTK